MKTTIYFISLILFVSCAGSRKASQDNGRISKHEKSVQDSVMLKNFIESGSFEFTVKRVIGQQFSISSGYYFLRIENGNAEAYLPFFGESIRYDFNGEGGINFNAPMTDYKVEYNTRKNYYSISFTLYDPRDQYQIYLDLHSQDMGSLRINSNNKSSMAYTGIIGEINKPKPRIKKQ